LYSHYCWKFTPPLLLLILLLVLVLLLLLLLVLVVRCTSKADAAACVSIITQAASHYITVGVTTVSTATAAAAGLCRLAIGQHVVAADGNSLLLLLHVTSCCVLSIFV
jgi:hypothetical protein